MHRGPHPHFSPTVHVLPSHCVALLPLPCLPVLLTHLRQFPRLPAPQGPHGMHVVEVFEAMGDDLLALIRSV